MYIYKPENILIQNVSEQALIFVGCCFFQKNKKIRLLLSETINIQEINFKVCFFSYFVGSEHSLGFKNFSRFFYFLFESL